jgi:hypothetical protein
MAKKKDDKKKMVSSTSSTHLMYIGIVILILGIVIGMSAFGDSSDPIDKGGDVIKDVLRTSCEDPDSESSEGGIWETSLVYGKDSTGEWVERSDSCVKREVNELRELSCGDGDMIEERIINCPQDTVCQAGSCVRVSECVDSDGGKLDRIPGTTSGYTINEPDVLVEFKDECVDSPFATRDRLKEYFCSNGFLESQDIDCSKGYSCVTEGDGSAKCIEG